MYLVTVFFFFSQCFISHAHNDNEIGLVVDYLDSIVESNHAVGADYFLNNIQLFNIMNYQ